MVTERIPTSCTTDCKTQDTQELLLRGLLEGGQGLCNSSALSVRRQPCARLICVWFWADLRLFSTFSGPFGMSPKGL